MSVEQNRKALGSLDSVVRRFQQALRQKMESARFQRSDERSAALCDQVHRAHHHLQLAIDALENRPIEEQLDDGCLPESQSWLRQRIGGLVGVLSAGTERERQEASATGDKAPEAPGGVLSGDTTALNIPDLVSALHAQGQTGVLVVTLSDETIELHFDSGALVHAFSHRSPPGMRLGEVLTRQGAISEQELASVLAHLRTTGGVLGEALAKGGWVEPLPLAAALTEQVEELFRRLWTPSHARYTFRRCQPSGVRRAAWNVTQLLLEGARKTDQKKAV
jgi:hypothetical protein